MPRCSDVVLAAASFPFRISMSLFPYFPRRWRSILSSYCPVQAMLCLVLYRKGLFLLSRDLPRWGSAACCPSPPIAAHRRPSPHITAECRRSRRNAPITGASYRRQIITLSIPYRNINVLGLHVPSHTHTHHRVIRVRYFARARSTSSPCESVFERLCTAHL